jgi:hypothetical protein
MLRSFTARLVRAKHRRREMEIRLRDYIDLGKTRRRIEDYLRKSATEEKILSVAKLLGVQVAMFSLPEVSEEEIRQAEQFEELLKDFPKTKSPFLKKFVLYYLTLPRYPNDKYPLRYSFNFFTAESAERLRTAKEQIVVRQSEDIVGMRTKIRQTNPKELFVEEQEIFKQLKQLLFPAK